MRDCGIRRQDQWRWLARFELRNRDRRLATRRSNVWSTITRPREMPPKRSPCETWRIRRRSRRPDTKCQCGRCGRWWPRQPARQSVKRPHDASAGATVVETAQQEHSRRSSHRRRVTGFDERCPLRSESRRDTHCRRKPCRAKFNSVNSILVFFCCRPWTETLDQRKRPRILRVDLDVRRAVVDDTARIVTFKGILHAQLGARFLRFSAGNFLMRHEAAAPTRSTPGA